MSKKLILVLALGLVLVSGAFVGAQADCSFCLPHFNLSSCFPNCAPAPARDADRPAATCQGAYNYGPTAPAVMSGPSGW